MCPFLKKGSSEIDQKIAARINGANPWGEQATLTSGTQNSMIPMKKAFFLIYSK
jgi:hypothetical protein